MDAGEAAFEASKSHFAHLVAGFSKIEWKDLPKEVKASIAANPALTAFEIAVLIVFTFPFLVATPALWVAGFGAAGPIAGSIAVGFQSMYGAVAGFSLFQSAAMAGYGVPIVGGMVKGAALAAGALGGWFGRGRGNAASETACERP